MILDCPARRPDFNTIENVWALMAQELTKDSQCNRHLTADQLWTHAQRKWDELRLRIQIQIQIVFITVLDMVRAFHCETRGRTEEMKQRRE